MKNCTLMILALLAAAVIAPPLAGALTVTITNARSAIVVTLSNSKSASKHSADAIAASARDEGVLLFCNLPAGIYSAVVLARE